MKRIFEDSFKSLLETNRILLLSGPPKVGKVAFAEKCLQELNLNFETIDFRNDKIRKKFDKLNEDELRWYFNQQAFFILGDAQLFDSLQVALDNVLTENIKSTFILCCAFEPPIVNELKEALKWEGLEFYFPAPTYYELTQEFGMVAEEQRIEQRLIFGSYPQLAFLPENGSELLTKITDEILSSTKLGVDDRVNKKDAMIRILQTAAHLIGQPISYNQIAERAGVDNETAERYLKLFEKAHLLFLLPSFHSEQKYELKKTHLIYFNDNGIRNGIIRNFNPINMRMDEDLLWKNWLISERIKWNRINGKKSDYFFWRSHTRQQLDFIEIQENSKQAYKFSLEKKKMLKESPLFKSYYPDVIFKTVNRSTYLTFLTRK
jgi:predicted AAA+ superfamily ATPase